MIFSPGDGDCWTFHLTLWEMEEGPEVGWGGGAAVHSSEMKLDSGGDHLAQSAAPAFASRPAQLLEMH